MVYFDTRDFENEYGHKPGRALGAWAFGTSHNPDVSNPEQTFWSYDKPYGEAKKLAAAWAKSKGLSILYILT